MSGRNEEYTEAKNDETYFLVSITDENDKKALIFGIVNLKSNHHYSSGWSFYIRQGVVVFAILTALLP